MISGTKGWTKIFLALSTADHFSLIFLYMHVTIKPRSRDGLLRCTRYNFCPSFTEKQTHLKKSFDSKKLIQLTKYRLLKLDYVALRIIVKVFVIKV